VINNIQGDLAVHAVSPNATHVGGVEEYDVHNLFGHQILNATYQALLEVIPGKRPFIIGRSTFAGSGKWAGHWGGDNTSLFAYMYFSISQALSFSIFGIPMVSWIEKENPITMSATDQTPPVRRRHMRVQWPVIGRAVQPLDVSVGFLPLLPQP
jgi:hypothetical protein